ncbi:hypothetical protein [Meiothermus ruber]|uniref:hypothetical protein n=1 Tax=Meiothermus ruber TaxID=277 RepID=UPI0023F64CE5|nr:hypothetical protein [Meiothermus ruber]
MSNAAHPHVIRMHAYLHPLHRFEAHPPQDRSALLRLWAELGPMVRLADPARYRSVQEALEENIPFPVLMLYVFRETRRALESEGSAQRKAE